MEYLQWFCLLVSYMILYYVIKMMNFLWWKPRNIQIQLNKQGIEGPTYKFLIGNNKEVAKLISSAYSSQPILSDDHNIVSRVLPFFHHYKQVYGLPMLLWFGPTPRLTITDPVLIREIFVSKSEHYEKYDPNPIVRNLEGGGLVNLKGGKWAHHRRIITPTFQLENLKLMIPMISKRVAKMLDKWSKMSNSGEVGLNVLEWFESSTEEIIMETLFGTTSDEECKSIFEIQAEQMIYALRSFQEVYIPGFEYVPTKKNRNSWKLNEKVRTSLMKLLQRHEADQKSHNKMSTSISSKGLLDVLMTSSKRDATHPAALRSNPITIDDIIEECKVFFFAGKHTTTNLMTWTMILLAMHPTWQKLAREEVLSVWGSRDNMPTKFDVSRLKTVHMIIYESLRLYPPVVATIRRAKADVDLGDYKIPKGTEILIPIIAIHHDEIYWGPDANDFNPSRFCQGVTHAAKHPMAFIPFALGPRRCIGQNLAILQAKLTIAMILQRFSFELSPSYKHSPTLLMILYPKYGAPIVFREISSQSSQMDVIT